MYPINARFNIAQVALVRDTPPPKTQVARVLIVPVAAADQRLIPPDLCRGNQVAEQSPWLG